MGLKRDNWTNQQIIDLVNGKDLVHGDGSRPKGEWYEGYRDALDSVINQFGDFMRDPREFGALALDEDRGMIVHIGSLPEEDRFITGRVTLRTSDRPRSYQRGLLANGHMVCCVEMLVVSGLLDSYPEPHDKLEARFSDHRLTGYHHVVLQGFRNSQCARLSVNGSRPISVTLFMACVDLLSWTEEGDDQRRAEFYLKIVPLNEEANSAQEG